MVQIINRPPTFLESISPGLQGMAEAGGQIAARQISKEQQQKEMQLQRQKQIQAMQLMGLDPSIIELPEQGQAAYFKSKFPVEKPMTSLQKSQEELNRAKIKELESTENLFGQFSGKPKSNTPQGFQDSFEGDEAEAKNFIRSRPVEEIKAIAAFAGQPGMKGILGNMAQAELDTMKEEKGLAFEKEKLERAEARDITKPLMLELQQSRKNIPLQEQAIEDIKNAAPEVGIRDYLADTFSFEPLRTSEGAKLKTAIKDFFLSDLTRVGARPNQWVEMQLSDALPKVGRSPEANLIVAEGMKFKVDLAKKRVEIIDDLMEKDRKNYGYVKANVDSRANQLLKPYVEHRKKELIDDITKIKKKEKTIAKEKKNNQYIQMISPNGELWEILPSDIEEAESHGYIRK